jgi:hypothetical protein
MMRHHRSLEVPPKDVLEESISVEVVVESGRSLRIFSGDVLVRCSAGR